MLNSALCASCAGSCMDRMFDVGYRHVFSIRFLQVLSCVFPFCSKGIFLKVIVANGRSSANTLWAVAPTARGNALEDWEGSGGRASERGEEVGRRASFLLKFNHS